MAEQQPINERRIPVYIELKSLEGELNDDWIVDYIIKTAEIKRINLNQNDLEKLIASNEVTYFFDGLDKVAEKYRTAGNDQFHIKQA